MPMGITTITGPLIVAVGLLMAVTLLPCLDPQPSNLLLHYKEGPSFNERKEAVSQMCCRVNVESQRMSLLSVIIQPFQDESTVLEFIFSVRGGLSPAIE